MHPHDYLKLRRRAAGLTIEEAQRRLDEALQADWRFLGVDRRARGDDFEQLRDPTADFVRLEAGLSIAGTRELVLIKIRVFPIDPVIYHHLGMGGTPRICRYCGCTQLDACFDGHGTCAWMTNDLCSAARCQAQAVREHRHAS